MGPTLPSSPAALDARARAGRLSLAGVLVMTFARTVLAFLCQGLCALVLLARGSEDAWLEAADWMTVWASGVDLGSLALLAWFLRREEISIPDLFRAREPIGLPRTLGLALLYLLLLGALGFAVASATNWLLTGALLAEPPVTSLPRWAGLYSTLVWPLLWGFTEEATYNGYAAPRLAALRGSRVAVLVVSLGWMLQHIALPFRADGVFLALRLAPSLAIALAATSLYLRTRRLLPLAIAHWIIDAGTGALTLR
jgi:membrane protease YdiL (CAAX protease family)